MPPAPLPVRAVSFARRHRLLIGLGAAFLLLCFLGVAFLMMWVALGEREGAPVASESPSSLARAFVTNQVGASDRFAGRTVDVTGCPVRVLGTFGAGTVELNDSGSPFAVGRGLVACEFGWGQREQIKALTWEQTVTIRGTCRGVSGGQVVLRNCRVIEAHKTPPLMIPDRRDEPSMFGRK